jgi:hypothetical protein
VSHFPPLTPAYVSSGPLYLSGWDRAVLGGFVLPGKARITRGGIKIKADSKSKAGADGATLTVHGLDPQEFELEVVVWTQDQLDRLYDICRQILPLPGVKRLPLALDHPSIRHFGMPIKVQVHGASPLVAEGNMRKLTIPCKHWMQSHKGSKPATATATRAVNNKRGEDNEKRMSMNPDPTQNQSLFSPPQNFTSGS